MPERDDPRRRHVSGAGAVRPLDARLGEEHTTWTDARFADGDSVFLEFSGCIARYHAPLGRLIHVGPASPRCGTWVM